MYAIRSYYEIGKPIRALCEIVYLYDCDVLLLVITSYSIHYTKLYDTAPTPDCPQPTITGWPSIT